ncbi:MAG: hypothetical protein JO287_00230 [Pseudonocardiales bacterium]|nr:hypothetical protein [Pseudonocardiales bacterium]
MHRIGVVADPLSSSVDDFAAAIAAAVEMPRRPGAANSPELSRVIHSFGS